MPAVGVPRPSPVSILTFILPTDAEHLSQVRVGVKCTETMARALPRRRGSGGGEGYGQMSWHAVVSGGTSEARRLQTREESLERL